MARRRKNEKRQKSIRYFDYSLLFLIIFLLCFGLIMLYSTSSYYGSTRFNDAAYYVKRQMYASALGIVAMLFISRIPYKFWMQLSTLAYFVALVLCTAVIFVGTSAKGQSRWLRIGPIQFQPSEIAKIAVIIFLATIIYKTPKRIGEIMSLLKIMLLISPVLAVVAYNNLSTAIIILGIAVCMLFVASPKYLQFILMGIGVCLFGALFILLASYRAERVMIWPPGRFWPSPPECCAKSRRRPRATRAQWRPSVSCSGPSSSFPHWPRGREEDPTRNSSAWLRRYRPCTTPGAHERILWGVKRKEVSAEPQEALRTFFAGSEVSRLRPLLCAARTPFRASGRGCQAIAVGDHFAKVLRRDTGVHLHGVPVGMVHMPARRNGGVGRPPEIGFHWFTFQIYA